MVLKRLVPKDSNLEMAPMWYIFLTFGDMALIRGGLSACKQRGLKICTDDERVIAHPQKRVRFTSPEDSAA